MKKLHTARVGYNIISILFCLAALLHLLVPDIPVLAVCLFSGGVLIAYGIIKIIGYFSEDLFCLAFRYDFAFGLLLLAIGVIVLIKHEAASGYLLPGFGWLLLLDSFFKIQMAEEAKKFGLEQWNIIVIAAVITCVAAFLLILRGFPGPEATRILTALALLSEGLMNRCVVKFTVKERGASPKYQQL